MNFWTLNSCLLVSWISIEQKLIGFSPLLPVFAQLNVWDGFGDIWPLCLNWVIHSWVIPGVLKLFCSWTQCSYCVQPSCWLDASFSLITVTDWGKKCNIMNNSQTGSLVQSHSGSVPTLGLKDSLKEEVFGDRAGESSMLRASYREICAVFACSPCDWVGFLWAFWFPPKAQTHGDSESLVGVNVWLLACLCGQAVMNCPHLVSPILMLQRKLTIYLFKCKHL